MCRCQGGTSRPPFTGFTVSGTGRETEIDMYFGLKFTNMKVKFWSTKRFQKYGTACSQYAEAVFYVPTSLHYVYLQQILIQAQCTANTTVLSAGE